MSDKKGICLYCIYRKNTVQYSPEAAFLFRLNYICVHAFLALKKVHCVCPSPLASAFCGYPTHRWWPAASLLGTPWGSSSTSSAQISFKIKFYLKGCGYLIFGLVILHLLTKFDQNAQMVQKFLEFFIKKSSSGNFLAKMLVKLKILIWEQCKLISTHTVRALGHCNF